MQIITRELGSTFFFFFFFFKVKDKLTYMLRVLYYRYRTQLYSMRGKTCHALLNDVLKFHCRYPESYIQPHYIYIFFSFFFFIKTHNVILFKKIDKKKKILNTCEFFFPLILYINNYFMQMKFFKIIFFLHYKHIIWYYMNQ